MRRSAFVALVAFALLSAQTAFAYEPWVRDDPDPCPTYDSCSMAGGDGSGSDPGTGTTTSGCLKCVIGGDGKSHCKDPNVYTVADGEIVSPCKAVEQCYWLGYWYCYPTCTGSRCQYI